MKNGGACKAATITRLQLPSTAVGIMLTGTVIMMLLLLSAAVAAAPSEDTQRASAQQEEESLPAVELGLNRRFAPGSLLPTQGQYVQYDMGMKNPSEAPIENQTLWVEFFSENRRSESFAKFQMNLAPGEETTLHIGPFHMLESGEHYLYAGINRNGNPDEPDEVVLKSHGGQEGRLLDSFSAYGSWLVSVLPYGIGALAIGIALIAVSQLYLKRRPR